MSLKANEFYKWVYTKFKKFLINEIGIFYLIDMIPVFEIKVKKVITQWKERFDHAPTDTDWIEFPIQDYMTRIVSI